MQSVIRNLTANAIVLPRSLNSFPLPAGADQAFTYPGISTTDLNTLVTLAKTGLISFPGADGLGIPAGFQVTPSTTYVINDQEPTGVVAGAPGYWSITDNAARVFNGFTWYSAGRDQWTEAVSSSAIHLEGANVKLADDRVFCFGGNSRPLPQGVQNNVAEIYDSNTDQWTLVDPLIVGGDPFPLANAWTCLLPDGKVLVAGGVTGNFGAGFTKHFKTFVFDPDAAAGSQWTQTGDLPSDIGNNPHGIMPAVVSPDGLKVFVGGGFDATTLQPVATSAIYTIAAGTWASGPAAPQAFTTAGVVQLANGDVVYAGGYKTGDIESEYAAKYSFGSNTWTALDDLPSVAGEDAPGSTNPGARWAPTMQIVDGTVYLFGGRGFDAAPFMRSSVLTLDASAAPGSQWAIHSMKMKMKRQGATVLVLDDGRTLVVSGRAPQDKSETFAKGMKKTNFTAKIGDYRIFGSVLHAHKFDDGRVMVVGGVQDWSSGAWTNKAFIFVPGMLPSVPPGYDVDDGIVTVP